MITDNLSHTIVVETELMFLGHMVIAENVC